MAGCQDGTEVLAVDITEEEYKNPEALTEKILHRAVIYSKNESIYVIHFHNFRDLFLDILIFYFLCSSGKD